jgi:hypothetical protein
MEGVTARVTMTVTLFVTQAISGLFGIFSPLARNGRVTDEKLHKFNDVTVVTTGCNTFVTHSPAKAESVTSRGHTPFRGCPDVTPMPRVFRDTRRLAQFTPERRQRYWRNVGSVGL